MSAQTWKAPLFFDLSEVESIAEEEAAITLNYTPPVVLPEEAQFETTPSSLVHEPEPEVYADSAAPRDANYQYSEHYASANAQPLNVPNNYAVHQSPWIWLLGSLSLLLVTLSVLDTFNFIADQFESSFFMGGFFLILISTLLWTVTILTWRSYQGVRGIRNIAHLQQQGAQLMEQDSHGDAMYFIRKVAVLYHQRPDLKARLERFYGSVNDCHSDREVCSLFSHYVLKDVDQQAYRIVAQRSKETAFMVMLSQVALLDTVLTLWRNVKMIRDIASLYGARPSFLGSTSLIIAVVQSLLYADVSEMLAESMAETLGNSFLSVMSAQAAQGVGSGILTARVGIKAMQVCRPLPFTESEKPRIKDIRWDILSSLKGLFANK